jgi:predicted membrane GTPase involved in stress response
MHLDLPLEQLVKRRGAAFQLAFASEAKALVPSREEFALSASHKGLHVLARNEEALAPPLEVLRDAYGPTLLVEPPKVRLLGGTRPKEPIMHVRVSLYANSRDAVRKALQARGAALSEDYVGATYCVLRCEAPLADLLGFPTELSRLTAGTAKHWIVLSHYAIVTRDPGGQAA